MRPKHLKFPFAWEKRRPTFHEGVFIVPKYFHHHEGWTIPIDLVSEKNEIAIEYCSGNGDWVIEKAKQNPKKFWIAVEKKFERVKKIWSKMHNHNISNLLIISGEAFTFTRFYLPESKVSEIYVNFPDPWPKRSQAKKRLVQKSFILELERILKDKGKASFATDDPSYSAQIIAEIHQLRRWKSLFPSPYYVNELENYGTSWFEKLWREKGKNFYYMQFEKCV